MGSIQYSIFWCPYGRFWYYAKSWEDWVSFYFLVLPKSPLFNIKFYTFPWRIERNFWRRWHHKRTVEQILVLSLRQKRPWPWILLWVPDQFISDYNAYIWYFSGHIFPCSEFKILGLRQSLRYLKGCCKENSSPFTWKLFLIKFWYSHTWFKKPWIPSPF